MGELGGKVAIVTGTSRGVGVGIAHELLRAGATVVGCSRSAMDAMPGTQDNPDWARRSDQMVCDQADYTAIDAFVQQVVDRYGRLDILVNNAGGTVPSPSVDEVPALVSRIQGAPASDDDYERSALFHAFAVQMNLISPLWFAIRAYRQMKTQDGVGCVINVSSGAGHPAGSPTLVSYGAAKAGLNQMTRSLAQEWGPAVRVNCVAPGFVVTPMTDALTEAQKEGSLARIPAGRFGTPEEIGAAVVYLASEEAGYVTGQTLHANGGMAMI